MSDSQSSVYSAHRQGQEKYTYFLLTAAGAAIALAVNQTQTATIKQSQLPLALAVICWGLSFFFGCRNLLYVSAVTFSNLTLLQLQRRTHPAVVNLSSDYVDAACEGVREAIKDNSDRANRFARWQFRCLVTGGLFYLAWHVLEMYLRSLGIVAL